jgi:hypothetical protein
MGERERERCAGFGEKSGPIRKWRVGIRIHFGEKGWGSVE